MRKQRLSSSNLPMWKVEVSQVLAQGSFHAQPELQDATGFRTGHLRVRGKHSSARHSA